MTVGRSLPTIWLVWTAALFTISQAGSNEFLQGRHIDTPLTPALTAPSLASAMPGTISMHAVEKASSAKKTVSEKDTVSKQQTASAKKNDEYDGFADESEDGFEDDSEEDGSSKRKAAVNEEDSEGNMESDSDEYSEDADLDDDSDDGYDRAEVKKDSAKASKKKQARKDEYDAEAAAQAAASDAAQQAHIEDSDSREVKSEEDEILSDSADNERIESEAENFNRDVDGDSDVDSCTDEECRDKKAKDDEDEEEDRKADDEKDNDKENTKSEKVEEATDEEEDAGDADSDQIEKEDDAIDSEAIADMEAQSELDSMDAGLNFFSAHPAKAAFGSTLAAPANSVILHSPAPKAQSTGKQTNPRTSTKSDVKKAPEIKREGDNRVQTLTHSSPKTDNVRVLTQRKLVQHARETKHVPAASTATKAAVASKHALVQSDDIDNDDTDAGEESAISDEQDDAGSEQDADDTTSEDSDDIESDSELDAESDSMIEGDAD